MRILALVASLITVFSAYSATHHDIVASLSPKEKSLTISDTIRFNDTVCNKDIILTLHSGLNPKVKGPQNVKLKLLKTETLDEEKNLKLESYELSLPCPHQSFTLQYEGKIYHPLTSGDDSDSRGSADTPGLIDEVGVYLASSTYWYPQFEGLNDSFVTFSLKAQMPKGWSVVSQGERLAKNSWRELTPQEDIYLIAAKFYEYEKITNSGITVQAYLRAKDDLLAARYIDVTETYINRYSKLIGPYPYKKFALVENFWDTGYGMPGFTLLGSNVIRLPFILYSSYPHEILHNWWGNSVYVDSARGNWCEGITAYLADHLMLEMNGAAETWRRDSLQKFTDYVTPKNDFPLNKFLGRTDGPTEAIGYGKAAMFFHMLRLTIGDGPFIKGLQHFNDKFLFNKVSYREIKESFENVSGIDLTSFFDQWVNRTGAPELAISAVKATPIKDGFHFKALIKQVQNAAPFVIDIPVAIHFEDATTLQETFKMNDRTLEINLKLSKRPVWFQLDPEFDVFRNISSDEVPPVLTMALGSQKTFFVLPKNADDKAINGWKQFIAAISPALPEGSNINVVSDSEGENLPADASVWVLGVNNLLMSKFNSLVSDQGVKISSDSIVINGETLPVLNRSFTMLGRNKKQIWTFVETNAEGSFTTLASKLIHYGKYSYLGFEGEKVINRLKGIWKLQSSSMSVTVEQTDGMQIKKPELKLEKRKPLVVD